MCDTFDAKYGNGVTLNSKSYKAILETLKGNEIVV